MEIGREITYCPPARTSISLSPMSIAVPEAWLARVTCSHRNAQSVTDNGTVTSYDTPSGLNQYTVVTGQQLDYDHNFNIKHLNGATLTTTPISA